MKRTFFAAFCLAALMAFVPAIHAQTTPIHSVTLSWTAPADATASSTVTMYRADGDCSGTPTFTVLATGLPMNQSYTDGTVTAGTYCYTARQVQGTAQSPDSNHAPVTVSLLPLLNFKVTIVDGKTQQ